MVQLPKLGTAVFINYFYADSAIYICTEAINP